MTPHVYIAKFITILAFCIREVQNRDGIAMLSAHNQEDQPLDQDARKENASEHETRRIMQLKSRALVARLESWKKARRIM